MAKEYLDLDGLRYLWQKIKNVFAVKADSIKNITRSGTTFTATRADGTTFTFTQQDNNTTYSDFTGATSSAAGTHGLVPAPAQMSYPNSYVLTAGASWSEVDDVIFNSVSDEGYLYIEETEGLSIKTGSLMSSTEKSKLSGIAVGAEVNQNAFSNVVVGSTTIAADGKTDTLTLVAGSNVTLTPDATNDKVTIAATYSDFTGATSSTAGTHGLVPAPAKNAYANMYVLLANGAWGLIDNVIQASVAESSSGAGYVKINSDGSLTAIAGNTANNVAVLDSSGKIPTSLLPSYVDDVIEAYARSGATVLSSTWLSTTDGGSALTPETGKIYVLMADSGDYAANSQFRWSGSAYVKLADGGVSSITNAEIDDIIDAA